MRAVKWTVCGWTDGESDMGHCGGSCRWSTTEYTSYVTLAVLFKKGYRVRIFFPVQLCILMDRNIIPHPVASIHYTHFSDELVSKTDAFLQYQWVHHCKHFRLLFIFSAEKKLLLHEKPIIFCLTLSRYCTEMIIFGAKILKQEETLSWGSKTLHVIR